MRIPFVALLICLAVLSWQGRVACAQDPKPADRSGDEIAQVYVTLPAAGEPLRKLVGWQRVSLVSGVGQTVKIAIDPLYLSIFSVEEDRWKQIPGEYLVEAGRSSIDIPLCTVRALGTK